MPNAAAAPFGTLSGRMAYFPGSESLGGPVFGHAQTNHLACNFRWQHYSILSRIGIGCLSLFLAPGCLPGRRRRVSEAAEKSRLSRDRFAPGAAFRCRADLRVHGRQRGVITLSGPHEPAKSNTLFT